MDLLAVEKELIGSEKDFENLQQSQQIKILKYLKKANKLTEMTTKRGFDVRSNSFFVQTFAWRKTARGEHFQF